MSFSATQLFNRFVTSGGGGAQFVPVITALAGNTSPMPVEVCALLNLPPNSTYGRAAAQCSARIASGQSPLA